MRNYLYKLTLILAAAASIAWGQVPAHDGTQQDAAQKATRNVQVQNPPATPNQSTIPMDEQHPSTTSNQTQSEPTAKLPQSGAVPNSDLEGSIQAALQQEPSLKDSSISVRQDESGIELSGTARNREGKKTAERIAIANAGGKSVKNHIKVTGPLHNNR
jgi:osmotically-inducible protein OsmY